MAAIVKAGFEKVQAFDTSWHADNFAGSTARKVTRAAQGYDIFVSCCYFFFLPSILLVLVTAATIVGETPAAAASMLVGSLLYFVVIAWYNTQYVMPRMLDAFAQDSRITGELVDLLGNNAAVKSWASERREHVRIGGTVDGWCRKLIDAWNMAVNSDQLQTAISAGILVAPIAITVLEERAGLVRPATVATVIAASFVLRGWLGNIGRGVREAQNAISEMTELVALFAAPARRTWTRASASSGAGAAPSGSSRWDSAMPMPDGRCSRICRSRSSPARPSRWSARPAAARAASSSCCSGLYHPQEGRILIDGQDIALHTRASARTAVALVPAGPSPVPPLDRRQYLPTARPIPRASR